LFPFLFYHAPSTTQPWGRTIVEEVGVERGSGSRYATTSLVVLAVLGVVAAVYLLKPILVPIALALLLSSLLSPLTHLLRRVLPLGPTGAAVVLFLLAAVLGLYVASLTAESLVQAANTLPGDIERLAGRVSGRINDMIRDQPYLHAILPEPRTIDQLGDANSSLLIEKLSYGLMDLSTWVIQGLIVLVLALFLLAESEMLAPKVIRFFAPTPGDAAAAGRTLSGVTRQIRAYLVARTLINLGVGVVFALALSLLKVKFPFALGLFAALTNFVPYVGQVLGGAVPALIALGQYESISDALIVAAVYVAIIGIEGYVVTPFVMGRSLDLNGTTVLIACLFWGFLWGLAGLILAMPITVSMKLVFQSVPELNRWAELMSCQWQSPHPKGALDDLPPDPAPPDSPGPPAPGHAQGPGTLPAVMAPRSKASAQVP
jgi:predicted PurR-regulated permease PerM